MGAELGHHLGQSDAEAGNHRNGSSGKTVVTGEGPQVKDERQVCGDRRAMLRAAKTMKNRQARMALRIAFYSGMRLSEIRDSPRGKETRV